MQKCYYQIADVSNNEDWIAEEITGWQMERLEEKRDHEGYIFLV